MTQPTSTKEGWFWAQWRVAAEGSSTDRVPSVGTWEVVQVVENSLDETSPEHLMVQVPGESTWQPLENFVWGPEVPPMETKIVAYCSPNALGMLDRGAGTERARIKRNKDAIHTVPLWGVIP